MVGSVALPIVTRKRRNPDWGRPMRAVPVLAAEFEQQVRYLRLTADRYVCSAELRIWCQHNRNRFCVPEWLLGAWGITVDPNVSDAA